MEFHSGNGVIAMCGTYRNEGHDFSAEWVQSVDYGIDFYAPQTLIAPDGRRIMIGWMRNWATTNMRPDNCPIFGAMTLPRELSFRNGRLVCNPVREIERYRVNPVHYENVVVNGSASFAGVRGRVLDMTVDVAPGSDYSFFTIKLAGDGTRYATITYRPRENTVTIDRCLVSKRIDSVCTRSFRTDNKQGAVKFRIIMDGDSIELFVNDGERAATFLVYNESAADGIEFETDKAVGISIDKFDIETD